MTEPIDANKAAQAQKESSWWTFTKQAATVGAVATACYLGSIPAAAGLILTGTALVATVGLDAATSMVDSWATSQGKIAVGRKP